MIKLFGIILILASAVMFSRLYTSQSERALRELSSLIGFIKYARERVGSYLEPLPDIGAGHSDTLLSECGFLSAVAEGRGLSRAFLAARDKLALNEEIKSTVQSRLEALDLSTKDGAVSGLDRLASTLDGMYSSERERAQARTRAVRITAIAVALGLSILLI